MKSYRVHLRINRTAIILMLVLNGLMVNAQQEKDWKSLFNGKNLEGWTVLDPPAKVTVQDGSMLLRMTTNTSRHAFIRSNNKYKDFILELEYKRDKSLDSGILFRAIETPPTAYSSLFGYMVKIDPSLTRMWTGGLFVDYGNGFNWLQTLEDNLDARKAEVGQGEWNKLRIEANGDIIKVWLNNVPCIHIKDDKYKKGYIAFKIHYLNSGDQEKQKLNIAFKNINIITKNISKYKKQMSLPLVDTRKDTEITYFR
jgi:hypothetical protein